MIKSIVLVLSAFVCGLAHSQEQPAAVTSTERLPPVINLGDVVSNVAIAKVQSDGGKSELRIAKFGIKPSSAPKTVTKVSFAVETRTRTVRVNGNDVQQTYTINVPVYENEVVPSESAPAELNRSVAEVSKVQAFDLKGNRVVTERWTKMLEKPTHVLLISEPLNETNRLDPFYTAILREDILLLYLAKNPTKANE
jgi:hypothetical protein